MGREKLTLVTAKSEEGAGNSCHLAKCSAFQSVLESSVPASEGPWASAHVLSGDRDCDLMGKGAG